MRNDGQSDLRAWGAIVALRPTREVIRGSYRGDSGGSRVWRCGGVKVRVEA